MIVGFDNDDPSVFEAQRQFLRDSRIPMSMTGMLYAIPKTPLHDRLAAEGRLDLSDIPEFGTNVIPLNIGRQELRRRLRPDHDRPLRLRPLFRPPRRPLPRRQPHHGPRPIRVVEDAPPRTSSRATSSSSPRPSASSPAS